MAKNNRPWTVAILHIMLKFQFESITLASKKEKLAQIFVGNWNKKKKEIKKSMHK